MDEGIRLDTVMDALSHEYRRAVLLALAEHNPQSASDPQGASDALRPVDELPDDATAPQVSMYHSHLPKLEAAGFIHWNRDAGTIEKGPEWAEIEPFVDVLRTRESTHCPDSP